jgi:hypothetical protein
MTDNNARRTGASVEAHFQFLMWLVPAVKTAHAEIPAASSDP